MDERLAQRPAKQGYLKGVKDMEIKIDLKELLIEEYDDERTLAEKLKDEIVSYSSSEIIREVKKEVLTLVKEEVLKAKEDIVTEASDKIVEELLLAIDSEYEIINQWGDVQGKSTLRKRFVEMVKHQLEYTPRSFSSDRNYFTRSIDELIETEVRKFKKEYNSLVDDKFIEEAMEHATRKLRQRLQIDN